MIEEYFGYIKVEKYDTLELEYLKIKNKYNLLQNKFDSLVEVKNDLIHNLYELKKILEC